MKDESEVGKDQTPPTADSAPEIYAVGHADGRPTLTRRTFLEIAAVAGAAAGAASLLTGCEKKTENKGHSNPYQPPAVAPTPAPTPPPDPAKQVIAHKEPITVLAVSSTGKLLASGDKQGVIKLWQLPEGTWLQTAEAPVSPATPTTPASRGRPPRAPTPTPTPTTAASSAIVHLAFTAKDEMLWSLDASGNLRQWALPDVKQLPDKQTIRAGQDSPIIAVPNAADWFSVLNGKKLEIRSQSTGETLRSLDVVDDTVKALCANADGRVVLAGLEKGNLGLWPQPSGAPAQSTKSGDAAVSVLTVAPDGTVALSAHADGKLRMWLLPGLTAGKPFESSLGEILCVALRPQKDLFAAGCEKPDIGLWKVGGPEKPSLLQGHTATVRAVVITPDGTLMASAGDDKTIRLWSLPDGKHVRDLMDLKVNYDNVKGTSYEGKDVYGRTVNYTLPCGSPIPAGAVCVCNCVPGSVSIPSNHTQQYSHGVCTCDLICTCNTVCTCQSVGSGYYVSYWYPN